MSEIKLENTEKKAHSSKQLYLEMITQAITSLNNPRGSTRQAIVKYIKTNFEIDETLLIAFVNTSLQNGVTIGALSGNCKDVLGSFKLASCV